MKIVLVALLILTVAAEISNGQSCPENEMYVSCTRDTKYCVQYCTQRGGTSTSCPLDPIPCNYPGCVCKDNYLRGPDRKCIPEDECPAN